MKQQICVVTQPAATSGLGRYTAEHYRTLGYPVEVINCRENFFARAWPALLALHPNRDVWYRRRWEIGMYSKAAWERHTRINGRMLDRVRQPGGKILQVGKEYFPHPDYASMEYYVFINYNAKLSLADGLTPWVPAPKERAAYLERETLLFQKARHVFTCGDYLKRNLVDEYGVSADRVTTVANGVNPFYLANRPPPFRETFTKKLLFVGWDFGLKGGRDMLAALPLIREKFPDVELLVVGPDEAQRQAQGAPALAAGVRWLGPQKDRAKLLELYREADLFLMPSLRDSYGFVFLEAMSQGLPCLGANLNGMPEIIADGTTGYIVPAKAPVAIAEAVCRYYSDGGNKLAMARATLARLHEKFTWDRVHEKMSAVMGV